MKIGEIDIAKEMVTIQEEIELYEKAIVETDDEKKIEDLKMRIVRGKMDLKFWESEYFKPSTTRQVLTNSGKIIGSILTIATGVFLGIHFSK